MSQQTNPTPTLDETYAKPSTHKQWQERSERPVITKPMTKSEIETLRRNLVDSYQCEDTDISYEFVKIKDKDDEDSDDCLMLLYKMKCVRFGDEMIVNIFSIKIPIPENVKKMAEQMKQRHRAAPVQALPAPTAVPVAAEVTTAPTTTPTKPRARKPAVRPVKK